MDKLRIPFDEVGPSVVRDDWRRRPRVFRSALSKGFLAECHPARFLSWTEATLGTVRLFQTFEDGSSRSGFLSDGKMAHDVFQRLTSRDEPFTLHMNDVELVDEEIFNLRQRLSIPYWWRIDDVIGTLSSKGSGIGYHAGHEDGFIVQLAGRRRWRIWSDEFTPVQYRKELLAPSPGPNPLMERPQGRHLLDIELRPGDVLYIPPFFPHEGVTLETSVSLSIAWKGLGPASFLPSSIISAVGDGDERGCDALVVRLFEDCDSAETALRKWRHETLCAVPEAARNEFDPLVSAAISAHILCLSARYSCTS